MRAHTKAAGTDPTLNKSSDQTLAKLGKLYCVRACVGYKLDDFDNFLLHYFAVEFAAVARTRALKERRARDKSAANSTAVY